MARYPHPLQELIEAIRLLPGVGSRSAERFAFHILNWKPDQRDYLSKKLHEISDQIPDCPTCGCLTDHGQCHFCLSPHRDRSILCIVQEVKDVFAIEETQQFNGLYHVLGSSLSPLDGRGPESLDISHLQQRIQKHQTQEVILALDSTLEGDATSSYLSQVLQESVKKVSRLAFGLPMGSALNYVDGGTLAQAFSGRQDVLNF